MQFPKMYNIMTCKALHEKFQKNYQNHQIINIGNKYDQFSGF